MSARHSALQANIEKYGKLIERANTENESAEAVLVSTGLYIIAHELHLLNANLEKVTADISPSIKAVRVAPYERQGHTY